MKSVLLLLAVARFALASPIIEPRATTTTPVVTITAPAATITGIPGTVEQFSGIPFALPPTGSLRLKPPQPITTALGNYEATQNGPAYPQFFFSDNSGLNGLIATSELGVLIDTPLFQVATDQSENCLYLNIHRPAETTPSSKPSVLFWILGGGFELGWNSMYNGVP